MVHNLNEFEKNYENEKINYVKNRLEGIKMSDLDKEL